MLTAQLMLTSLTRHRASTSMYSLTFCVRVMLPERHQWKSAVQAAAVMLRMPFVVRPRTDRQTDTHRQTHRRAWPQYILRRLRLTQNVIISILDVLNNFISKQLTVKSRDWMFLLDNEQTSKPYSKIGVGLHFWRISCKNTYSDVRLSIFANIPFTAR